MTCCPTMNEWIIHVLETPEEMTAVEELQRLVWAAPDIEIVPKDHVAGGCP